MAQIFSLQAKEWTLGDGYCTSVPLESVPAQRNIQWEKIGLLSALPVLPKGKGPESLALALQGQREE